jgi:hypothetical protein
LPTIADAPPRSRRTAWIVGIIASLAAFSPLLVWQCGMRRARTAATLDAVPTPPVPVDAANDAVVVVVVPVDAPVDARTSTGDARVATTRRADARTAGTLVADAATVARASIDATGNAGDDGIRTFVSERGARLVFAAGKTVEKTGPDLPRALTGRYTKHRRLGEIRVEWSGAGADHPRRERFVRATCGLERVEWEDSSGGRHRDSERYAQRDPPCTDDE